MQYDYRILILLIPNKEVEMAKEKIQNNVLLTLKEKQPMQKLQPEDIDRVRKAWAILCPIGTKNYSLEIIKILDKQTDAVLSLGKFC